MYIKKDFGDIKNSTNKSNFDLPMHQFYRSLQDMKHIHVYKLRSFKWNWDLHLFKRTMINSFYEFGLFGLKCANVLNSFSKLKIQKLSYSPLHIYEILGLEIFGRGTNTWYFFFNLMWNISTKLSGWPCWYIILVLLDFVVKQNINSIFFFFFFYKSSK